MLEPSGADDPYFVRDRLLQKTLPVLAKALDPVVLDRLPELVSDWAAHARAVSLYLRSAIATELEPSMITAVASQAMRPDIAPWVRGWLLDPLARCDGVVPEPLLEWLAYWLSSAAEPWFVRGRAALVLAQRQRLPDQETIGAIFDRAPPQTQADLLAAVLLEEPDWADSARAGWVGPSPLLRSVVEIFDETVGTRADFL